MKATILEQPIDQEPKPSQGTSTTTNGGLSPFSQQHAPAHAIQENNDDAGWEKALSRRTKQRMKKEAQGTLERETPDKGGNDDSASKQGDF